MSIKQGHQRHLNLQNLFRSSNKAQVPKSFQSKNLRAACFWIGEYWSTVCITLQPETGENKTRSYLVSYISGCCNGAVSCLQSIANSIMTKQNATANQILRPLKAVLPPVTQEEFDRYGTLNTDDLVKKVKDTLSQFSISQRCVI